MLVPLLGLLLGLLIGMFLPMNIPPQYTAYVSIALLAAFDGLLGGICADLQERFDGLLFITGFVGNMILAAGLAYLGDRLDVPLYLAAIFAFGVRLFKNFAVLRRLAIRRLRERVVKEGKVK